MNRYEAGMCQNCLSLIVGNSNNIGTLAHIVGVKILSRGTQHPALGGDLTQLDALAWV